MRVIVLVKANEESEAGVMPTTEMLTEMGAYNEELVKAGVMLAGEGLHASAKGVRIYFSGDQRNVVDGPFTEAKEVIGGYALIEAASHAAARSRWWASSGSCWACRPRSRSGYCTIRTGSGAWA